MCNHRPDLLLTEWTYQDVIVKRLRTATRRIVQTPRVFSNWTSILGDIARERAGRGPDTLTFRTRAGVVIESPNRPGARVPVYEMFAEDSYHLREFLGRLVDRPISVLDIGGHIGTFSSLLTNVHPKATVTAYEPSATSADFFRRNVARNGVADRVTVVEAAVSGASGFAAYADNGAGSGLNGLVSADHDASGATEVRTVSFDEAAAATAAPVDVVKMDCEGAEYDLVLGSSPESWASVERVVLEYHPVSGHGWDELRDFFATAGLSVQQIVSTPRGYGCVWLSREPLTLRVA